MLILGSQNILSGNYAAISYQFLSSFFSFFFFVLLLITFSLLAFLFLVFLFFHCAFVALVPLFFFLRLAGAALAVEIKVIKDLPWPPPVGQLNSTPTVVEELESPTQTAQAPPGQTCCDQHHHGGCCAHILPVCHLRPSLSVHRSHTHPSSVVSPSVMSRNERARPAALRLFILVCQFFLHTHKRTTSREDPPPPKNSTSHKGAAK